jgi:hypothetical protein
MRLVMVAGYGVEPSSKLGHDLAESIYGYDEKKRLEGVVRRPLRPFWRLF